MDRPESLLTIYGNLIQSNGGVNRLSLCRESLTQGLKHRVQKGCLFLGPMLLDPGPAFSGAGNAEVGKHARPDVGEAAAAADRARWVARAEAQDRDVLPRVVGSVPGGVVAVIGRDDDQVAVLQGRLDLRDAPV